MKLKAQINEERSFYRRLYLKAKKENNEAKAKEYAAVVNTLDWVKGSRNEDEPIHLDYKFDFDFTIDD